MTNMENLQPHLDEQTRQDQIYDAAMLSLQAAKRDDERNGYAVMSAAMGYGEGSIGDGVFAKVTHGAQLFCIAFACAAPPFLVWHVLL